MRSFAPVTGLKTCFCPCRQYNVWPLLGSVTRFSIAISELPRCSVSIVASSFVLASQRVRSPLRPGVDRYNKSALAVPTFTRTFKSCQGILGPEQTLSESETEGSWSEGSSCLLAPSLSISTRLSLSSSPPLWCVEGRRCSWGSLSPWASRSARRTRANLLFLL